MSYEIYKEFPREKILPLITEDKNARVKIGKFKVRVGSTRLQTLRKSQKCAACGREGVVFRLERTRRAEGLYGRERHPEYKYNQTPHFNLYAIEYIPIKRGSKRKFRKYVLMTRDHIYPRSRGGLDTVDNSQTLCERCNSKKSDKIDVKHITQFSVQEMLKNLPVKYPIQVREKFCVNF